MCRVLPEGGQQLAEADELVVLHLFLSRAEVRVIEVLPPSCGIDAGRLEPGGRVGRDPDVLPSGRDHERLDPLEPLILDPPPLRIDVAERLAPTLAAPPTAAGHRQRLGE